MNEPSDHVKRIPLGEFVRLPKVKSYLRGAFKNELDTKVVTAKVASLEDPDTRYIVATDLMRHYADEVRDSFVGEGYTIEYYFDLAGSLYDLAVDAGANPGGLAVLKFSSED